MTNKNNNNNDIPRRVPALVIYLHPFRLVESSDQEKWEPNIDEINSGSWDYIKPHEISGGLDVGLEPPYHMLVCRDGALALPPIPELRDHQNAVEFFNKCLASFVLGGIYCEAVTLDNLEFGSILDWKYIRVQSNSPAAPNRFHNLVRLKMASPLEAISILDPRVLPFIELQAASTVGLNILNDIPQLNAEFFLKGVTGIARRDWGNALSNLWIVIEQCVSNLWSKHVLDEVKSSTPIKGRLDQLKDFRTWSIASRLELLHQRSIISTECFNSLFKARKARNDLAHKGVHPSEKDSLSAYEGFLILLSTITNSDIPLAKLKIEDHMISDPFSPPRKEKINPTHWMPIPKLPNEEEIEKEEFKGLERTAGSPKQTTSTPQQFE